jgi:Tfp pilus assembly protein PilN
MSLQNSSQPGTLLEQLRGLSRRTIIIWLVAASLVFLFIPLYLVTVALHDDADRLETDLQAVQAQLANASTPDPEVQGLMDTLSGIQSSVDEIETARATLTASHVDWPSVMAAIGSYNPEYLTLTSLTQTDSRITLEGQAADNAAVTTYLSGLEGSGLFSRVVLQSVRTIATPLAAPTGSVTATPAVTPTATVTPTMTPTPTASPLDEFETDDFEPKTTFLGQSQRHNFYPVYDVDKVEFLAKADRWYRVYTSDLAPGVDTFLTVEVGGISYTNDDRGTRDLSSEVVFQVRTGYDVNAVVRVTNRGEYGPDMWYLITVEEIVPTPTPSPTSTPPPATSLPPTSTPPPTVSPEPTGEPPSVTQITPASAETGSQAVEATIAGSGFYGTPRVFLIGVGADIEGTDVSVTAGQRINCTFDLSGREPGVRDVMVVNPDEQVDVLPDAFTIYTPPTVEPTATISPTVQSRLFSPDIYLVALSLSGSSIGHFPSLMFEHRAPRAAATVEFVVILELKQESP